MDLRTKLKNIEIVDYIYHCIINAKSKRTRAKAIEYFRELDSELICLNRINNNNRGIIMYYIDPVKSYTSGFCSNLSRTLLLCKYADEKGYFPTFYYKKKSHYTEEGTIFGTRVFLEYFFEKPCADIMDSEIAWTAYNSAAHLSQFRKCNHIKLQEIYAEMMGKFFRFNEKTMKKLIACEKETLPENEKILGVKYRGTDYNVSFKDHPIPATVNELLEKVNRLIDIGYYQSIYLATEDAEALEAFKERYGKKLHYITTMNRYEYGESHIDNSKRSDVQYPAYTEGLNLLKDLWVLSKCNGFIGSRCGVSDFAIVFNKVYSNQRFNDTIILDKGIRIHGRDSLRDKRNQINVD